MRILRLTAVLIVLLILTACGRQTVDNGQPADFQVVFTARPLELGDGQWELVWTTDATAVTLDGVSVEPNDSRVVSHSEPHTYVMAARRGNARITESLTITGLSDISISAEDGAPLVQAPGLTLQLSAEVTAEGSDVLPSQTVTWSSLDEAIASVDSITGLVTMHNYGSAEIQATSAQWTGLIRGVTVIGERIPEIAEFQASPWLETGGQWQLSWSVDADEVDLNGDAVTPEGTLLVDPVSPVDYILSARNGDAVVDSTLRLAPVGSVSIPGFQEPLRLLIDRPVQLDAVVSAPGSEQAAAQAVMWHSNHREIDITNGRILAMADPGQPVDITVTSVQSPDVSFTFEAVIVETAIDNFDARGVTFPLSAGSTIQLSWSNAGAESLRLVPIVTGNEQRAALGLSSATQQVSVDVPRDKGWLNFELQWQDPDGRWNSLLLWDELQPVSHWVCSSADNDVVTIEDQALRGAIEQLFILTPGDEIRCSDVQRDFTPNLVNGQEETNLIEYNRCDPDGNPDPTVRRIESLEGLQHLTNLYRLELECNELTDISHLSGLSGLVDLNLDNNLIHDLRPLQNLTGLEALGLYNNRVEDVSSLENLVNLEVLYLSRNQIKDVSGLAGLTELRLLWLFLNCESNDGINYFNCLRDLSPLTELHQLETLVIHRNAIDSLEFISAEMDQLQHIQATGNQIRSISSLSMLPSLRTVALDENFLPNVDALVTNEDFPAGEPYTFERGTAGINSTDHLALGYNCFLASENPGVTELLDRGVLIPDHHIFARPSEECVASSARLGPTWIRMPNNEITRP